MALTEWLTTRIEGRPTAAARFLRLVASALVMLVVATSAAAQTMASGQFNGGKFRLTSIATTVAFDVAFDVPIPDKVWGDPLPMGGGDPGRVFLAYHKALVASDVDAVKAVSDARAKGLYEKHEREGRGREYFSFRWEDIHRRMQSMTIVGGFVRGDSAVVLSTAAARYTACCTANRRRAVKAESGWSTTS